MGDGARGGVGAISAKSFVFNVVNFFTILIYKTLQIDKLTLHDLQRLAPCTG